jgi:hypothetical protein
MARRKASAARDAERTAPVLTARPVSRDVGREVCEFMRFWPDLSAPSWNGWRDRVLARLTDATRELWCVAGRGAGKSRVGALLACYMATRKWPTVPGENIFAGIIAPDKSQAALSFRYVRGLFAAVPELEALVAGETKNSITLSNGVQIEVITGDTIAPRGRSYACVVVEEAAFLQADERSAKPDAEILRAIRPGLARVPASLLVVLSSPWARRGELWKAEKAYGATGGSEDGHVVYVRAGTTELNPLFDRTAIDRAFGSDAISARTEYGAEFRADIENFVSLETIERCTVDGRTSLPLLANMKYFGFVDVSGGSGGDSAVLAIAHHDPRTDARVLDAIVEMKPPFEPSRMAEQFARVLRSYGLTRVVGDAYAAGWSVEAFRKCGIVYEKAPHTKSELYILGLPMLTNGTAVLLDNEALRNQLLSLERRASRGTGRENVDHPPGGHDDVANAAMGALVLVDQAQAKKGSLVVTHSWTDHRPYSGVDRQGREWRKGAPWNGRFPPKRDLKGRPTCPWTTYVDGRPLPWTEADWAEVTRPADHDASNDVPPPPRRRRISWGI